MSLDLPPIPHQPEYSPGSLAVFVGPQNKIGKHVVTIRHCGVSHTDAIDAYSSRDRQRIREQAVAKFGLPDDAHEWLEERIQSGAMAADTTPATSCLTPEIIRLADVTSEQVDWLWRDRVAIGKVTMWAGNPGLGKSFTTIDMAARVSTGRCWPDNRWEQQPVGGVVLLSAEDDLGDTIRPRLDAHAADVSRIVALKSIRGNDSGGDYSRLFDLGRDLEHLSTAIDAVENCRLVVVDPVSAYLGNTDSHKNADVRALLSPLSDLAAEKRVAMVLVSHLRKGEGQAIYRTMGSLAFVAAARACWVVTEDPAIPRRRLLLPTKNNLGSNEVQGLAFTIEAHGTNNAPAVCWEAEPVTISADEAMGNRRHGPAPDARQEATEWLREQLAIGPTRAKEIAELADDAGFSKRTIQRAYREMGGKSARDGFGGPIIWSNPILATNDANAPCDWQRGVNGDAWRECENPEEERDTSMFHAHESAYVPGYESRARLDAANGELAHTNGDGNAPF